LAVSHSEKSTTRRIFWPAWHSLGLKCLCENADNETMGIIKSWGDIPEWSFSATLSILQSLKKVDPETYNHCLRVGEYSRKLARDAGFTEYQQRLAEFAGILHDVGKIGVNSSIINKPGKLSPEEMQQMQNHPIHSAEIVEPLTHHEFFAAINPSIRAHHERIDGEGYPDKLRGEEIPVLARIVLIVDTLDAMGETRAYRKGLPVDVIYKELQKYSGSQFDPQLVSVFLQAHKHWSKEAPEQETLHKIAKKAA
jgi:putative nucleotidyltransferase with HDIG domain